MYKKRKGFVFLMILSACLTISFSGLLTSNAFAIVPQESTFFSSATIDEHQTTSSPSYGDLWPSCWADDGYLYAANGDGTGFQNVANTSNDIVMNRINGTPGNLTGTVTNVAGISQVWSASGHNRKPTGMACVGGVLYAAVQDLNTDFNDAPAATIAESTDHGVTWTWNTTAPMFNNYTFTTIFFLDYGQNNINAIDTYVYAYGLDDNWRASFNNDTPDPTQLFLARVPATSIMDRSTWQFYAGDLNGNATWSSDITQRKPVLQDDRRVYVSTRDSSHPSNMTVLSQGSVVYNKPLNRYIYSSWTEYTYEFYEAPSPWGPWKHFYTKDYGGYPWTNTKNGGYATTIPSKFISADGKTMAVQSNTFVSTPQNYDYSTRNLVVVPYTATTASNAYSDTNLARQPGVVPFEKSAHYGNNTYYNDGVYNESEDSWDQENKTTDFWGYSFNKNVNLNKVVYTTGNMFTDGGWFSGDLRVQVRQNFKWVDVDHQVIGPNYPYNNTAGTNVPYTFTFDDTWGDAVRIIGIPGGTSTFTSIGELDVYYSSPNILQDSGFENQPYTQATYSVAAPWSTEGTDQIGIDVDNGHQHSGAKSAFIRTSNTNWNAIKQTLTVTPNTQYVLTGWIKTTSNVTSGYFGVRDSAGNVLKQVQYGNTPYAPLTVSFNSGNNSTLTVFAGYWGPGPAGTDSWINIDDITLR